MAKAIATVIAAGGPEVAAQMRANLELYMMPPQTISQGGQTPIHDAHLVYLMVHEYLLETQNNMDKIDH